MCTEQEIKIPKSNNKKDQDRKKEAKEKFKPQSNKNHTKRSNKLKEIKINETSAEYTNWDNQTEKCIKYLLSSIEAPTDGYWHIFSTISSSGPEPAIILKKCDNCNALPLHVFKGNTKIGL